MSKEAREAAFVEVMGSVGMPDQNAAEYDRWLFDAAIDAYLAALSGTHVMVPREPTEAMMWSFNFTAVDKYNHRNLSQAFARDVYRAMLSAAEGK